MITLIHPSRSRPHQSHATMMKWRVRAGVVFELIVSVDEDDIELEQYKKYYPNELFINKNRNAIEAINRAAKIAKGNIMIIVSDDTDCPAKWGVRIEALCKNRRDFVIKTYDGVQSRIITMPIFDKAYYNRFGYVYNPEYDHMFADTEYTDVAHMLKRVTVKLGLRFPHRQYSVTHGKPDALNLRNNATMDKGREIYKRRKRLKFGL